MKKNEIYLIVIAFSIFCFIACEKESTEKESMVQSTTLESSIASKTIQRVVNNGCSYPFTGVSKGWVSGTFNLATDKSTDKKYVWRYSSGLLNSDLGTYLQYKVTLKSAYPIVVRVVAVSSSWGSESYDLYDGCYYLQTANTYKQFAFWMPTSGSPGSLNSTYKAFDFEIIIKNRTATGKTLTTVPVTVTVCASGGGGC